MAVQISGNDITVPRDGTFSRNVSIAGTLTYEDVTNVDSIGIVTARNGIEVGASPGVAASISVDGNMIVSGISTFGGDVQVPDKIIHAGDTNTAIRFPAADALTIETGGSETFRITGAGATISTNNSNDSELTVEGTGGATVHLKDSGSGEHFRLSANGQASLYAVSSHPMVFYTGGVASSNERLRIGTSGQIGIAGANYGTDGQVLTSKGSSAAVQWASASSATSGTYTSVGTGYYKDITTTSTNIVKYDIIFTGVSIGGGMEWQFQLGDSGGIESSGYNTVSAYRSHNTNNKTNNPSNAFRWYGIGSASFIMDGRFSLTRIHNNKWFGEGLLVRTEAGSTIYDMIGTKELSGALTTIRISSSVDDSEVFDGGHYKVIEHTGTV